MSTRTRLVALASGLVLACLTACSAPETLDDDTTTQGTPSEPQNATQAPSEPTQAPSDSASVKASLAAEARATDDVTRDAEPELAGEFGDGHSIVGADVEPGRYRTMLPAESADPWVSLCYVEISSDGSMSLDSIIAQELVGTGRTVLVVPDAPGAVIESSGCGEWERIDSED